jgi:hypothetical protein
LLRSMRPATPTTSTIRRKHDHHVRPLHPRPNFIQFARHSLPHGAILLAWISNSPRTSPAWLKTWMCTFTRSPTLFLAASKVPRFLSHSHARTHARMLTSCCGDGCTYRGRVGRQEGPGKGWYSDPPVGVLSGPAALCLHAALHPLYQAQRQEVAHGLQLRVPTLST